MDREKGAGGRGLLQLAGGSGFDAPGARDRALSVAIRARGPANEGRSVDAPDSCLCYQRTDLAGGMVTLPGRAKAAAILARLPSAAGICGRNPCCPHRAFGRFPQRHQRPRVDLQRNEKRKLLCHQMEVRQLPHYSLSKAFSEELTCRTKV